MKKIFIVDDDRDIVESMRMILEAEGYVVGAQYDEQKIVENVAAFAADAVILDVMFPEDHSAGFSLARTLKKDEKTKKIPILMLSAINERGIYAGKFSQHDIDDTFLPVNDFIEKPAKPKVLVEKLKALLEK
jgi:CheY-like chemotaxis protein